MFLFFPTFQKDDTSYILFILNCVILESDIAILRREESQVKNNNTLKERHSVMNIFYSLFIENYIFFLLYFLAFFMFMPKPVLFLCKMFSFNIRDLCELLQLQLCIELNFSLQFALESNKSLGTDLPLEISYTVNAVKPNFQQLPMSC